MLSNPGRKALGLGLVLLFLASAAMAGHADRPGPPARTGDCRWLRGRFAIYNGSGVRRIWIFGTRRIIAIPDDVSELPEPLASYQRADPPERRPLYARFHVCALEDSRPGRMQHVRVDAVRAAKLGGRPFERLRSGDDAEKLDP